MQVILAPETYSLLFIILDFHLPLNTLFLGFYSPLNPLPAFRLILNFDHFAPSWHTFLLQ